MVYVDDAFIPYGRMKMSHMVADSHKELLEMVDKIGVKRKWIQDEGTYREHFDVCKSKREMAIEHGAEPVSPDEILRVMKGKRFD